MLAAALPGLADQSQRRLGSGHQPLRRPALGPHVNRRLKRRGRAVAGQTCGPRRPKKSISCHPRRRRRRHLPARRPPAGRRAMRPARGTDKRPLAADTGEIGKKKSPTPPQKKGHTTPLPEEMIGTPSRPPPSRPLADVRYSLPARRDRPTWPTIRCIHDHAALERALGNFVRLQIRPTPLSACRLSTLPGNAWEAVSQSVQSRLRLALRRCRHI